MWEYALYNANNVELMFNNIVLIELKNWLEDTLCFRVRLDMESWWRTRGKKDLRVPSISKSSAHRKCQAAKTPMKNFPGTPKQTISRYLTGSNKDLFSLLDDTNAGRRRRSP